MPLQGVRLLPVLAAGAALAASASGCGGSDHSTVDATTVQHSIAASILAQRHVPTTVKCPSNVQAVAGIGFTCVAKLEVGTYPVAVVVKNSKGNVRFGNRAPLVVLNVPRVQRAIEASISSHGIGSLVTCPAHVLQQRRA